MPLSDLRVLELGHVLAGPWAATMLGWYGAQVIKVEPPEGDPLRTWRELDEGGTSLWWRSVGRNKRCAAIDVRVPAGQDLVRRLAARADVLVENFTPGRMEGWGLGPDALRADHPGLVYARVSGYGQTGPQASRPGYASVCEAVGGLRHLTGRPGEPPVRANLSLADTLAGMSAMIGILTALHHRERTGLGQVVDVALTETVFSVLEAVIPEAVHAGVVRGPSGPTITGVAPTNAYPCADGREVVIGANSAATFQRLCEILERPELPRDPRFATNASRWEHREQLDGIIGGWTRRRTASAVVEACVEAGVPAGPIQSAADLLADPQLLARGMFERAAGPEGEWVLPALAPRLDATPGRTRTPGPALGAHTVEVLDELGVDPETRRSLEAAGVVRSAAE